MHALSRTNSSTTVPTPDLSILILISLLVKHWIVLNIFVNFHASITYQLCTLATNRIGRLASVSMYALVCAYIFFRKKNLISPSVTNFKTVPRKLAADSRKIKCTNVMNYAPERTVVKRQICVAIFRKSHKGRYVTSISSMFKLNLKPQAAIGSTSLWPFRNVLVVSASIMPA